MSQIMMPQKRNQGISQDYILLEKKNYLHSSTNPVACIVCSKGLDDGYSLTARQTRTGTVFYCNKHLFA